VRRKGGPSGFWLPHAARGPPEKVAAQLPWPLLLAHPLLDLGRVSKDLILEAVTDGVGPDAARRISGLKKHAKAQEAERLLAEKGWLPAVLKPASTTAHTSAVAAA